MSALEQQSEEITTVDFDPTQVEASNDAVYSQGEHVSMEGNRPPTAEELHEMILATPAGEMERIEVDQVLAEEQAKDIRRKLIGLALVEDEPKAKAPLMSPTAGIKISAPTTIPKAPSIFSRAKKYFFG